jgi:putative YphP/YqiW family bacilliredoxin
MPYPETLVAPMREELARLGVQQLRNADEVEQSLGSASDSTVLLIVNSVCGCAAANARPAVRLALQSDVRPDHLVTVFAGQDLEATEKARTYLPGIPPSSPFLALLKNKQPMFVLERKHIEGRSASSIAAELVMAFGRYCGTDDMTPTSPEDSDGDGSKSETFRSIM